MSQTPSAKSNFNSTTPEVTDTKALDHIVSGNPFHITSGEQSGKYVFKTGREGNGKLGLYKYETIKRITKLERSPLKIQPLFDAITRGEISLDAMALEGKAKPNRMNLIFLEDLVNNDGFQITSGLGSGSYSFETKEGKLEVRDITPEISGGAVAGFLSHKSRLLAEDFLIALQKGTFQAGIENSILFNLAKGKKDHVAPPRRSLGV